MPASAGQVVFSQTPLEQLNVTQDETEYLFYTTSVYVAPPAVLTVEGWLANTYSVFLNGSLVASQYDCSHQGGPQSYSFNLAPNASGVANLTILSGSLGIHNGINNDQPASAQEHKGIVGNVTLAGVDITGSGWTHHPFLAGEVLGVYTLAGGSSVAWTPVPGDGVNVPLTWFRTTFPAPSDQLQGSILVNMTGTTRGHMYLNGFDLGRYVVLVVSTLLAIFDSGAWSFNSYWTIEQDGVPVQQYYYIPRDLLLATNTLVLAEEVGAPSITSLSIVLSTMVVPDSA